jgi:glycosyltransferase involved in cell wall biosynthesis
VGRTASRSRSRPTSAHNRRIAASPSAVSTRPRIALLANYPADHATFVGGIQSATAALLQGLRAYRDEFELYLVSLSQEIPADMREEREGVQFHFLRLPRQRWFGPRFPFRVLRTWLELKRIEPHLVHCQSDSAAALAAMLGSYPRLATVHGVVRHEVQLRTGWEFWAACVQVPLEHFTYRHFDDFVCISRYAARVVGTRAHTYPIPNAVDARLFRVRRTARSQHPPYLLFVGVLAPLKRPADLLVAHARLRREFPTLRTVFCGHTEDRRYEKAMLRMVDDQTIEGVELLGHTSRERLARLLSEAAALVLPSAQENAPMVIGEAMAAGVPVVATRVGGIPDMIRHGETGLLYEPGDVDGLTHCLRGLLGDAALRERLGQKARLWAQSSYTPERVAEATVAVYRHLLGMKLSVGDDRPTDLVDGRAGS